MPPKYRAVLAIAPLVLFLDQATKLWAVGQLTDLFERSGHSAFSQQLQAFYGTPNLDNEPYLLGGVDFRRPAREVVAGFWSLRYVENPGAAWGMLSRASDRVRVPFFHAVSLVAVSFIAYFLSRLEAGQVLLASALGLILGGALGNYVDRVARGYVIDFVDWYIGTAGRQWHWPTFNVADAAISLGVAAMLLDSFRARTSEEQGALQSGAAEPQPSGGAAPRQS